MFSADTSGVVFDTRSKMVMWQGGTTERMKEKVRHLTWGARRTVADWTNVKLKTTNFAPYQEVFNPTAKYFMSVLLDLRLSPDIHFH